MIDPKNISCVLISKDPVYPLEIIQALQPIGFGEILILCNSDSQHRKQELFAKAKHEFCYYQDDDCIAPARELIEAAEPGLITSAMKPSHIEGYKNSRIQLLGWGSVFPKIFLKVLNVYRAKYGEDPIYCREDTRIFTWLCYPCQKRLPLPIMDLPSAYAEDRLWRQPGHWENIRIVEERCATLGEIDDSLQFNWRCVCGAFKPFDSQHHCFESHYGLVNARV